MERSIDIAIDLLSVITVSPSIYDVTREYRNGFPSYLAFVMDGPERDRYWSLLTREEASDFADFVTDEIKEYWEANFYDHTYGFYRGMTPQQPFKESIELVRYVTFKLIRLISSAIDLFTQDRVEILDYRVKETLMFVRVPI